MNKHKKSTRYLRTRYAFVDLKDKPQDTKITLTLDQKFNLELKRFKKLTTSEKNTILKMWNTFSETQRKKALAGMKLL